EATPEQKAEMLAQAQRAPRHGLIDAIKRFNEAALVAAGSWQPQLPLELAFVELLPDAPVPMRPVVVETAVAPPPPSVKAKPVEVETAVPPVEKAVKTAVAEPEPPKPEATPAKAQPKTEPKPLTVRQVQAVWAQLVSQAGEKIKNLPALLNMGKPLAAEGRTLVIGFDYPLFKDKFDNLAGANKLVGDI